VVDELGSPIPGAEIMAVADAGLQAIALLEVDLARLRGIRIAEATADARGRFSVAAPTGSLRLLVRAPGRAPVERRIGAERAEATDLGDIALEAGVVLRGRVIDHLRQPVAGAVLLQLGAEGADRVLPGGAWGVPAATTDAAGAFRIDQLRPGPWRIVVHSEHHPDLVQQGTAPRPGAPVEELELALAPGGEIFGRVSPAPPAAGEPLWVEAVGEPGEGAGRPRRARCAPDGSFVLSGLRLGATYRLAAREGEASTGRLRTGWVEARAGDTAVVLPAAPRAAVTFQVVDAATGQPLTELDVRAGQHHLEPITAASGAPRTFVEGRVRIDDLLVRDPRESVQIVISAEGYREQRLTGLRPESGRELDLGKVRLQRQ
jgi:hypothetical protein